MSNIKFNIQYVHGPTAIKLAHCFCLIVECIAFLLIQDFIKFLCPKLRVRHSAVQQCIYFKFFKGARILVKINVFFSFTVTMMSLASALQYVIVTSTSQMQHLSHFNLNKENEWLQQLSSSEWLSGCQVQPQWMICQRPKCNFSEWFNASTSNAMPLHHCNNNHPKYKVSPSNQSHFDYNSNTSMQCQYAVGTSRNQYHANTTCSVNT